MSLTGTVTLWINQIKAGNQQTANDAFRKIWERYSARMAGFAHRRFQGKPQCIGDEEDILQSVFRITFQRARDGQLQDVADREDLWKLLVGITAWKSRDQVRKQTRQKRGGGRINNESVLGGNGISASGSLDKLAISNSSPEMNLLMAEELEHLLSLLGKQQEPLRIVAEMKMEGADHPEIQSRLNCSLRTVERKLRRIREIWELELKP